MPDLYAVAGSKIYIGGVLASKATDFVVGDYSSQTWVEVDGWETAGQVGDSAEIISTSLINQGRVNKQKGTNDAGEMENNFAILPTDPGQLAMVAAQKTKSNYAFKIVWSDGTTEYFIALVGNRERSGGGANDVQMRSFTLSLNSNIVTV